MIALIHGNERCVCVCRGFLSPLPSPLLPVVLVISAYKMLHVPDVTTATQQQEGGRVVRGREGGKETGVQGEGKLDQD